MALITVTPITFGPAAGMASMSYTYDDVTLNVVSITVKNPGTFPFYIEFKHKTKANSTVSATVAKGQLVDATIALPPGRFKMGLIFDEWTGQDELSCLDLEGIYARWPA